MVRAIVAAMIEEILITNVYASRRRAHGIEDHALEDWWRSLLERTA